MPEPRFPCSEKARANEAQVLRAETTVSLFRRGASQPEFQTPKLDFIVRRDRANPEQRDPGSDSPSERSSVLPGTNKPIVLRGLFLTKTNASGETTGQSRGLHSLNFFSCWGEVGTDDKHVRENHGPISSFSKADVSFCVGVGTSGFGVRWPFPARPTT